MSGYGWIVTHENVSLDGGTDWQQIGVYEIGLYESPEAAAADGVVPRSVYGPSTLTDEMRQRLDNGEGLSFTMHYDGDEAEHLPMSLKGRGIYCEGYEPLRDYGGPSYGAITIRWANHPEMDHDW